MISSVYDYYLSTYSHKKLTRSNVHKKSELRNVYNSIIKLSRKSPLYKLDLTPDTQKYIIDLKECAIALKDAFYELDVDARDSLSLIKTKAVSSNEYLADVRYIGLNEDSYAQPVSLSVHKLATPQINTGNYLQEFKPSLEPGDYTFEISIGKDPYEFQTSIKEWDTNRSLQERIARLINNAKIGLTSEVRQSANGSTALEIMSVNTGLADSESELFKIKEAGGQLSKNFINYLGINATSTEASNANVTVNGTPRSIPMNTFPIMGQYEVTLHNISEEEEITMLSLEEDYDSLIQNIKKLADHYNNIIDVANDNSDYVNKYAFLYRELSAFSFSRKNNLDAVGLTIQNGGRMNVEESLFIQSIREGSLTETIEEIKFFKENIIGKINSVILDPAHYVNKRMVLYPHPLNPFVNPYITSIYTGMIYNGYI